MLLLHGFSGFYTDYYAWHNQISDIYSNDGPDGYADTDGYANTYGKTDAYAFAEKFADRDISYWQNE